MRDSFCLVLGITDPMMMGRVCALKMIPGTFSKGRCTYLQHSPGWPRNSINNLTQTGGQCLGEREGEGDRER